MRYLSPVTLVLVALLTITACGGSNHGGSSHSETLASITISDGNNQTAVVGTELPNALVAVLLNTSGTPLAGQTVNFRVVTGNGTLFAGTATSDSQGVVRERWTLGTMAGAQQVEIRAINSQGTVVTFATFNATGIAGKPTAAHTIFSEEIPVQLVPISVTLIVGDQYRNPVNGIPVSFNADYGLISQATAITGLDGRASIIWTLGKKIGVQILTTSVGELAPIISDINVQRAAAGAATRIAKVSGDLQLVSQHLTTPLPLNVIVTDSLDNPVPNISVTFSPATESTPKTVVITTDINGMASFAGYFHNAGQQQVRAVVDGIGTVDFDVSVTASNNLYDGNYICVDSPGFELIDNVMTRYPPLQEGSFIGVFTLDSLDENTGSIAFRERIGASGAPYRVYDGQFLINSQQVTVGGTSYKTSFSQITPWLDWSCERQ